MASESSLESQELENIPLVRMEDVQPDRRIGKANQIVYNDVEIEYDSPMGEDQCLETFVVEGSELQCVLDDSDNYIGSMVSIKCEGMEESEDTEIIIPEILESLEVPTEPHEPESPLNDVEISYEQVTRPRPSDSWPTLEILPGGVINLIDKSDRTLETVDTELADIGEMLYACAKCSQSFKYLFCLVKHVRWHEEIQREKFPELTKMTAIEKKMADLQRRTSEMDKIIETQKGVKGMNTKTRPKEKPAKQKLQEKYICLHSGKRKIMPKLKRRLPKKS